MGLLAVVLACADAPRPVQTKPRWPVEAVAFTVRTVDPAGQPVSGVKLVARRADEGSLISRSGTSDATGTVRLRVMPGWYVVQAEAPGFVRTLHTDARIPPGEEVRLELTLARAAPFAGRVVDLEGRPVAGAQLRLTPSADEEAALHTESDEDGRFRFDNVPAGAVKLLAEKEEWSPTRLKLAAPQPELTVVMGGLSSLRVQVRGPDGQPLSGGPFSISSMDDFVSMDDMSPDELSPEEAQDATVFPQLPAGRYLISGRYTPVPGCEWTRGIVVQVLPGQQAEATVSFEGLHDAGPWRGRAVDANGKALDHGTVVAWGADEEPHGLGLSGRCTGAVGQDGSFAIPHVFKAPRALTMDAPEGARGWEARGPLPAGTGEAVVFRRVSGSLKGRVVRPDGQPVGFFEVNGRSPNNPRGEYVRYVDLTHTYQWVIDVWGFAPALVRAQGREGEVLQVPDVVLEEGRTVQGRVFASNGRSGVPHQEVELMEEFDLDGHGRPRSRWAMTDAEGRFELKHVPGRRQFLRVASKEHGTVLHALEPDETAVRLRLVPNAELHGFVTDGAQVPLAGVSLEVRCEGGFKMSASSDGSGHYAMNIPADRECFVHPEGSPLNLRPPRPPQPPPVFFSSTRLRVPSGSRQSSDFEPRQGPASLEVSVEASREFVTAFVLPGDVAWPRSPEALDALMRAGFGSDPMPNTWESENGSESFVPHFLLGADFRFSRLPLGHYTVFIRDEMDGADAILRIPVELTRTGVHVIQSARPARGGGRPYTR
ncbi:carboxypeptidase-like regulatory domain-containing protein [Corallococcus sp. CA054B]|uniref:carboxypeptidase-like regulatory domain-containing protein n=1 Tax=Corallococcus sp. CA054B TaxID=2316734 RepID=UPI001F320085|nr:carboxypeptidase-like regulatory domain-containing protein [Corallococcus sp. CA054B]